MAFVKDVNFLLPVDNFIGEPEYGVSYLDHLTKDVVDREVISILNAHAGTKISGKLITVIGDELKQLFFIKYRYHLPFGCTPQIDVSVGVEDRQLRVKIAFGREQYVYGMRNDGATRPEPIKNALVRKNAPWRF